MARTVTLPTPDARVTRALPAAPRTARAADAVLMAQTGQSLRSVERRIDAALDLATPEMWEAGSRWYAYASDVVANLAGTYALPRVTVARLVAALSPRTRWAANVDYARAILANRDTRPVGCMPANYARALDALSGRGIGNGPKVQAFALNVESGGEDGGVTIDVWACRIALVGVGARGNQSDWRGEDAVNAYCEGALGRKGVYGALALAYARVAARRGISPAACQAIAWIAARGNAE